MAHVAAAAAAVAEPGLGWPSVDDDDSDGFEMMDFGPPLRPTLMPTMPSAGQYRSFSRFTSQDIARPRSFTQQTTEVIDLTGPDEDMREVVEITSSDDEAEDDEDPAAAAIPSVHPSPAVSPSGLPVQLPPAPTLSPLPSPKIQPQDESLSGRSALGRTASTSPGSTVVSGSNTPLTSVGGDSLDGEPIPPSPVILPTQSSKTDVGASSKAAAAPPVLDKMPDPQSVVPRSDTPKWAKSRPVSPPPSVASSDEMAANLPQPPQPIDTSPGRKAPPTLPSFKRSYSGSTRRALRPSANKPYDGKGQVKLLPPDSLAAGLSLAAPSTPVKSSSAAKPWTPGAGTKLSKTVTATSTEAAATTRDSPLRRNHDIIVLDDSDSSQASDSKREPPLGAASTVDDSSAHKDEAHSTKSTKAANVPEDAAAGASEAAAPVQSTANTEEVFQPCFTPAREHNKTFTRVGRGRRKRRRGSVSQEEDEKADPTFPGARIRDDSGRFSRPRRSIEKQRLSAIDPQPASAITAQSSSTEVKEQLARKRVRMVPAVILTPRSLEGSPLTSAPGSSDSESGSIKSLVLTEARMRRNVARKSTGWVKSRLPVEVASRIKTEKVDIHVKSEPVRPNPEKRNWWNTLEKSTFSNKERYGLQKSKLPRSAAELMERAGVLVDGFNRLSTRGGPAGLSTLYTDIVARTDEDHDALTLRFDGDPDPRTCYIPVQDGKYAWVPSTSIDRLEGVPLRPVPDLLGPPCSQIAHPVYSYRKTTRGNAPKLAAHERVFLSPWLLDRLEHYQMRIHECGRDDCDHCVVWPTYVSRQGRGVPLQVKDTGDSRRGFGLFANGPIKKGQFITIFGGEVLTVEAMQEREESAKKDGLGYTNYAYDLPHCNTFGTPESPSWPIGADFEAMYALDPKRVGGVARFTNHSCQPNAVCIVVCLRGDPVPILAFFALSKIPAGEEITITYKGGRGEARHGRKMQRRDQVQPVQLANRCFCGQPNCSGTIYDDDDVPD